ncbi:unnamed protein product [Psylliodes chrysocephalus]|uniref:HAT C-terminal dimerisation domain-containing protein n=1 Tax=Psylliodes chrysocephalus TaxID=3402493 RepID=A0A9P0CJQ2_9CUCU|nr:unnamed protein product [Psylliodes chrysocephala]
MNSCFLKLPIIERMWAKDFIWTASQNITPVVWWKGIIGQNNRLSKVAVKILSISATSASTERTFPTFSAVHTKKKNKLTTRRAIKLTYITHYWRTRNKAKTAISSLTQVTESVQHSNMIVPEAEIPGPSDLSKSPINFEPETETETSSEDEEIPYQDSDSDEEDVTDEVNSSETEV